MLLLVLLPLLMMALAMRPHGALEPSETLWGPMGLYGAAWTLEPCGTLKRLLKRSLVRLFKDPFKARLKRA